LNFAIIPNYYIISNKNIIDTINGDANAEISGKEGLKSLEVLIASYISSRSGKVVSLPLDS